MSTMAGSVGICTRFGALFLRILQFCCAAVGLGIFSYFLAVLANDNVHIADRWRAVEGIVGAATLYTIFAILFVLCLAGSSFFGFLAIILDICFIGGFIAVAWFTRHGANSCTGFVNTPLGSGPANARVSVENVDVRYPLRLKTACELNTAVFAVSIIACFLFLLSAIYQVFMISKARKEKRYGPSPKNNYTSGSGKAPFWKRKNKRVNRDMEATGTYGGAARPSGETGTTLGNNNAMAEPKYGEPGYGRGTQF